MEYVKENLLEYVDTKFFNSLFEAEEEFEGTEEIDPADFDEDENGELDSGEKNKLADQMEKQGMKVVKKCQSNWKAFKTAASNKWQEYRDFWAAQKEAEETIGIKGLYYNLYMSNYIVAVIQNASGKAELIVYNTSHDEKGELETFICKSPVAVKEFKLFKNEVEVGMKEVIAQQKAAMIDKKEADKLKLKTDAEEAKTAELDTFLNEPIKTVKEEPIKENLNEREWGPLDIDISPAMDLMADDPILDKVVLRDILENQYDAVERQFGEDAVLELSRIVDELDMASDEEDETFALNLLYDWADEWGIPLRENPKSEENEEDNENWVDPAGGIHYSNEEDPARMYEFKAITVDKLLNEKQFTEEEREKFAKSGIAMKDGSFPIENKMDLKNAIRSVGRSKNPKEAKQHIKKRARALASLNEIPDDWK